MEYERIHKVQTGILSPSKLRMKLMGAHNHKKKDGSKSNSNSSRTSPSKIMDSEFVKSLLDSNSGDLDEEVSGHSLGAQSSEPSSEVTNASEGDKPTKEPFVRENSDAGRLRVQQMAKIDGGNMSAIYQMRMMEDENLDYDSNASSSSFEFHKGERSVHSAMARSHGRPVPSKWNDAEKWIMSRQNIQANYSKKSALHGNGGRLQAMNMGRVAPECVNYDHKPPFQSAMHAGPEKFSFVPSGPHPNSCHQTKDSKEADQMDTSGTQNSEDDKTGVLAIRSVCMRDMGTEMTPGTSLEPSRTATPVGATTPLRSPTSSIPSTPRRGAPTSTPVDHMTDDESQQHIQTGKKELSEEEMKLKTRKEIQALGVQLGKMNIAAWASKDEEEKKRSSAEAIATQELVRAEMEKRAVAWEEAEKTKHTARYKREEIKIQAWESQQKAKLEAELRKIEAQVEEIRAQAQAKMVKKIAMARQRSEEKRAAAEARKNRDAERTAAQAEYLRQTGRMPSTNYTCCGWL